MIKYLIHFRSLTLICLCLGSRAGGRGDWAGRGKGEGRAALASVFSSVAESLFIRHVTEHRKSGGGGGSVANVFVTASICRCVFCLSRTTSSNLVSRGTRQCPGNHLSLLNNFFPAALLLDQTSYFTRQLINLSNKFALNVNKLVGLDCELRPVGGFKREFCLA